MATLLLSASPRAEAPTAGSVIGNAAIATFVDADGEQRTVTSNLVETVVQQVYGLTLESDRSQVGAAGQTLYFPHTLTNTGNGTDSFALSAADEAGDGFDFTGGSIAIYPDVNGDGRPDGSTTVSSVSLTTGQAYNFVVAAQIPPSAASETAASLTVGAARTADATASASNRDTATVTDDAAILVTKAMSATSGAPSDTQSYTVTLSYTNTGDAAAQDLALTDALDPRFAYVSGSGRASITGANPLTDDAAPEPATSNGTTIDYAYSAGGNQVSVNLGTVAAGASGTVTFEVRVPQGTAADSVPNTASYGYLRSDGTAVSAATTNKVIFTVGEVPGLTFVDEGDGTQDEDGLVNDVVLRGSVDEGGVAVLRNLLTNTGNVTDVYDITVDGSAFPAGTSFQLLGPDGVSPLLDTDGDGVPDSGALAPGESAFIYLRVSLPTDASGSNLDALLTARSSLDAARSDSVTDRIGAVTLKVVDLTNDAAFGAPGAKGEGVQGPGGETTAVNTESVAPGGSVVFDLFVNNRASSSDNYDLAVVSPLPSGWTVDLYRDANDNGVVDTGDVVIANTGTVPAGGSLRVLAAVFVPAGQAPGVVDIVFRSLSPNSGAVDHKKDAVSVQNDTALTLEPDHTGETTPGGIAVYEHTITNQGNVATGALSLSVSDSGESAGWKSVIYLDSNGNGRLDSDDAVYDPAASPSLDPRVSLTVFVKSFAPSAATSGASSTATLTVTSAAGGSDSATDTTVVVSGNVTLRKLQALDVDCDGGEADGDFVSSTLAAGSVPGACIQYRVEAENVGAITAGDVVIKDQTPAFTTLEVAGGAPVLLISDAGGSTSYTAASDCAAAQPGLSAPGDEAQGLVAAQACDLPPGAKARLSFSVQIDE